MTKKLICAGCGISNVENDHELDLQSFMEHWQNQIVRMIKEEATKLANKKLRSVYNLVEDLENRLKDEIRLRLEDWEKDLPEDELFSE